MIIRTLWPAALAALAALVLAACGSSSSGQNANGLKSPASESQSCVTRGGTLVSLQESDYEHIDPGIAYGPVEYSVVFATQRPLYSNKPNSVQPTPDLAESMPGICPPVACGAPSIELK